MIITVEKVKGAKGSNSKKVSYGKKKNQELPCSSVISVWSKKSISSIGAVDQR